VAASPRRHDEAGSKVRLAGPTNGLLRLTVRTKGFVQPGYSLRLKSLPDALFVM